MEKIVHVTGVRFLGGHRLHLQFDDGISGELDFADEEWSGVFAPLRDSSYFGRVELDDALGTVTWPNGADVAPETLHQMLTEAST
jgi:Protein of unknown function (DUF2442)